MIGEEIGSYRITEFIAKGEVSFVYKAYEPSKKKYFAVKVFTLSRTRDHNMVRNFLREAEIMAGLEHDHILPIYDLGRQEGIYYIVTRYVNASPLSQIMDEFRQPRHVNTLLRPLANALEYLHLKNVIHGNVKPNNILVDVNTNPYLTSIGFAARLGGATTYGAYAAPEQALGVVEKSVDVYALGVLTYELLAGELPATIGRPNLRRIRPDIPGNLHDVLMKAMDPDPEKRYESCLDFSDSLVAGVFPGDAQISEDTYPSAAEIAETKRRSKSVYRRKKRRKIRLALILTVLFLLTASVIYLLNLTISSDGRRSRTNVTFVSAINDANVRSGPGIIYPVVGILRKGDSTIATGTNRGLDWYEIYTGSDLVGQAWISARMVEPEDNHILRVIDFSEGDIPGFIEIGASDGPVQDFGLVEDSGSVNNSDQRKTDDAADRNLAVRASDSPAEPDQEGSWIPNSLCGLPAVFLLFAFFVPFGRGIHIKSPGT